MKKYLIKVTERLEIKILDYPSKEIEANDLAKYIGKGCDYIEWVKPRALYTSLGEELWQNDKYDEGVSMFIDEEGTFKEDNIPNLLATALYDNCIVGNVLFVGTFMNTAGVGLVCGLPPEHLKELVCKLALYGKKKCFVHMPVTYKDKIFETYNEFSKWILEDN